MNIYVDFENIVGLHKECQNQSLKRQKIFKLIPNNQILVFDELSLTSNSFLTKYTCRDPVAAIANICIIDHLKKKSFLLVCK